LSQNVRSSSKLIQRRSSSDSIHIAMLSGKKTLSESLQKEKGWIHQ
jgi:hypothetical protein